MDGLENPPVSFEILNDHELIGAVVVRIFWGQLHIKNLAVSKKYRGLNLAKKLMERAFAYGRAQGCTFAFVETMNFQAPEFYQKLGFKVDFVRSGYAKDTSFYYLRKNL
jgi:ribosomal protein S18 acetylase RimI-like enzyme